MKLNSADFSSKLAQRLAKECSIYFTFTAGGTAPEGAVSIRKIRLIPAKWDFRT